ncbi:MAG: hypothetical protein O2966_05310 [Proteobacteria bacterium]|nr:hypothetical protein [Pseudomonadota bacterium]
MGNLDTHLYIIVVEMIVILAVVLPYMENKAPKQVVSKLLLLLLGLMLTHTVTHLLPNAVTRFIYGSHYSLYVKQSFT